VFERAETDLVTQMRAVKGFRGLEVIQTSEYDVILVILGENVEVLDQIATEIGSPWMRENVVPLLAGPPDRHIGPSIVSSGP
jgi:hypothetical protein